MLDVNDAVRVEKRPIKKGDSTYNKTIYIFECSSCGKEMPKDGHGIRTHTGLCTKCVKRTNHPYQRIYNNMLSSINSTNSKYGRDCPVSLSFEEFLIYTDIGVCHYCGLDNIRWAEYANGPYNLDRKDNSKGYEVGNLAVCCYKCNYRKNNFYSHEQFVMISELLKLMEISTQSEKHELLLTLTSSRLDRCT